MRISFAAILISTLASPHLSSAENQAVQQIKNGAVVNSSLMNVKVQFYDDNIVRVVRWKPTVTDKKTSLCVILDSLPSLPVKLERDRDNVILSCRTLKVTIAQERGRLVMSDLKGNTILKEVDCEFVPVVYRADSAFSIRQTFELSPDEGIYGLGQHQDGYMNYRGRTVKLVQSNTEAVIPFLISTNNYGILWDNYSKTIYEDDGEKKASLWSDVADNIDYYVIRGKNMDEVIAGYRKLTGQAPLYGRWAYGYWQSKEHYHTQDELMNVAVEYRERRMPIDNIVQDWDYWNGPEHWGGMFFDKTLFPTPAEMLERLHTMHYHMMISIWPALGPQTEIYREMYKHGYLYSPVGWAGFKYYDAYNPAADSLYWSYLKKGLLSKGIDALWIDSTEPDVVNAMTKESTEYEMKRVDNNFLGTFARYLNPYSLVMTSSLHEDWRKDIPDRRCYILTRSTFAGQQRNAATTWSGDIGASWDVYRRQISAGLNHCMSGVPYWTFDIGGFVLGAYDGVFTRGGKDPAYQELYARMFQFGAFCPIFRSHGSETPREIWEMGEFVEPILKFDQLRYRLLPYIYSLAWKVTSEGYTVMRGLPMDFAADKRTYSIDDQFMFGPSIMVCPVTHPQYHRPPEPSVLIDPEYFKTNDGKPGLRVSYYRDNKYGSLGKEEIVPNIDIVWYTGRPSYVTDSMFSIRWEGRLIPKETGRHQFHMKSYDAKRMYLDGERLPIVYTSVEQYTDTVDLIAGREYGFVLETENSSTGAARMRLFWKTPSIFAKEQTVEDHPKTRPVYLPRSEGWIDFWTGEKFHGGQERASDAPIDKTPLFVRVGSILPMGPFVQYATEKPADPFELRIYPGADGRFVLYEDENDNYNYEKGIYATVDFRWNEAHRTLTIGKRQGTFPGMIRKRRFRIVVVSGNHGVGIDTTPDPDKIVEYDGTEVDVRLPE